MKEKANMFIQGLNNEFGNILQKVRLFFLRFFQWALIRPNKNISAVRVTCQKKLGRVGREFFFFFQEFFLY